MPRTKAIPAYCLHKPSGQARVRIDGKDHYLGPHGSEASKREYEQIVRRPITARAAAEVRARVEIATDLTVSERIAGYLQHAKTYYVKDGRQTTEFGGIAMALRPVRKRHGHELVTTFGPLKLKSIREQWIADGLVRTQVNAKVGRVRRMSPQLRPLIAGVIGTWLDVNELSKQCRRSTRWLRRNEQARFYYHRSRTIMARLKNELRL